jgi:hypothetical protein
LGYSVKRLDRQKPRARPDFLISNSAGPQLLCEVKTVFSGGYLQDKGVHVSMLDDNLHNFGVFQNEIDLTQISDDLADAVRKREALVADENNDPASIIGDLWTLYSTRRSVIEYLNKQSNCNAP